jgi:predicted dehydrogenase
VEVHAYSGSLAIPEMRDHGAFDACVVNLLFAGGAIGNVESYLDAKYGYDIRTEIVGTRGTLMVGQSRKTGLSVLTTGGKSEDVIGHWLDRFGEAYRLEMVDFVETLLKGRTPWVTGFDGRQSLAIAEAAVESIRENRPARVMSAASQAV